MRPLLCLLLLSALPAIAQEEPPEEGEIAPSEHPGSDSPEAVHAKYDGPRHRAQAFLIPMDEKARTPTARVGQAVEEVLLHTPAYEVVDLGRALSVESTAEQAQHADAGRALLKEGAAAAAGKGWPEAAAKYQRAKQEFDLGLPAVGPREYADAVLRLATAEFMGGEDKPAAELFALAARLDPGRKLVADEAAAPQLEQARAGLGGARHCQLDVDVRPAGAKIYFDGELRGQHIDAPSGRHLLRVDRPGFYPYAEVIELLPKKPTQASITLMATPTAASLSQIIAGASEEVGKGLAGRSVQSLAQKFSLERVMIGTVRSQEDARVSVTVSLVDAVAKKVIASRSLLLTADGTDADQIEGDVGNATRKLVEQDAAPAADATAAAAPAAAATPAVERKVAIPGAMPATPAPTADDPGLVAKERKVAMPAPAPAPASKAEASKDAPGEKDKDVPAPASKAENKKKPKARGIQGKTGTEDWGDDD
ncbi:MAG TPA: PEGA domain-containing protein [Myxococcales bacterium]|nr:PEGA domain-containing protein [Myxococcales bacterium]